MSTRGELRRWNNRVFLHQGILRYPNVLGCQCCWPWVRSTHQSLRGRLAEEPGAMTRTDPCPLERSHASVRGDFQLRSNHMQRSVCTVATALSLSQAARMAINKAG